MKRRGKAKASPIPLPKKELAALRRELGATAQELGKAPAALGDAEVSPGDRRKVGRNEPCPCGSGKKYKKCCLRSGKYE